MALCGLTWYLLQTITCHSVNSWIYRMGFGVISASCTPRRHQLTKLAFLHCLCYRSCETHLFWMDAVHTRILCVFLLSGIELVSQKLFMYVEIVILIYTTLPVMAAFSVCIASMCIESSKWLGIPHWGAGWGWVRLTCNQQQVTRGGCQKMFCPCIWQRVIWYCYWEVV